jgi:hypothetical protein
MSTEQMKKNFGSFLGFDDASMEQKHLEAKERIQANLNLALSHYTTKVMLAMSRHPESTLENLFDEWLGATLRSFDALINDADLKAASKLAGVFGYHPEDQIKIMKDLARQAVNETRQTLLADIETIRELVV